MSDALERARAGDRHAFEELVAPHRGELLLHCYRMLGSLQDGEDALQETLLAAWLGLAGFEGRSSVRTWLYRIATNRSLNYRRANLRREARDRLPAAVPAPTGAGEVVWLQPYPDALLDEAVDPAPGPEARYEQREAVSLAFIRLLQILPPQQRAALVLRDVLGYPAAEAAQLLDTSVDAVNGALKRARGAVAAHAGDAPAGAGGELAHPAARPVEESAAGLLERFVAAFTSDDVGALVALFTDDVWVRMPPLPQEYRGRQAAAAFFRAIGGHRTEIARMVPLGCNRQPACAEYVLDTVAGALHLVGILVLDVSGDRVSAVTHFDTSVAASLGVPRSLDPGA